MIIKEGEIEKMGDYKEFKAVRNTERENKIYRMSSRKRGKMTDTHTSRWTK